VKIEGYEYCIYCDRLVPRGVWIRSNGYCGECVATGKHPAGVRKVVLQGRVVSRPKKRKGSKGHPDTIRRRRLAEVAAMRRLKRIYPAVYVILLGEERAKRDLDPLPVTPLAPRGELVEELREALRLLEGPMP